MEYCPHVPLQTNMFILGIDLSKAFDTIDRHKVLLVIDSILDPDEVQIIKALLGSTTLQLRLGMKCYSTFASNHGTPQGYALSPLLFVVYLEAVLRDLCQHLRVSMRDLNTIAFADDVGFIHHDPNHLEYILLIAERVFRSWSLTIIVRKRNARLLLVHRTRQTKVGAPFARWDHYLATPKTYSSENLTQQQLSKGFENCGFIRTSF